MILWLLKPPQRRHVLCAWLGILKKTESYLPFTGGKILVFQTYPPTKTVGHLQFTLCQTNRTHFHAFLCSSLFAFHDQCSMAIPRFSSVHSFFSLSGTSGYAFSTQTTTLFPTLFSSIWTSTRPNASFTPNWSAFHHPAFTSCSALALTRRHRSLILW